MFVVYFVNDLETIERARKCESEKVWLKEREDIRMYIGKIQIDICMNL